MVNKLMYQKIQYFKRKGFSKAEIVRETGFNKRTVWKYYKMSEKQYVKYIEKVRFRAKIFEPFKFNIFEVYKENEFQELEKSAVYDYLEEKLVSLPGTERSFRNYITYLIDTEQLKINSNSRIYYPVDDLPFGQQLQIDFGEYRKKRELKLYIFAAVLSASRYKYCALQDRPFTTMDLISHLMDCFEYMGGIPKELVIDQDSVMVVSENKGDIIYTGDFKLFKEEMNLKIYVCRKNDPESKVRAGKEAFRTLRDLIKVRIWLWQGKYR